MYRQDANQKSAYLRPVKIADRRPTPETELKRRKPKESPPTVTHIAREIFAYCRENRHSLDSAAAEQFIEAKIRTLGIFPEMNIANKR